MFFLDFDPVILILALFIIVIIVKVLVTETLYEAFEIQKPVEANASSFNVPENKLQISPVHEQIKVIIPEIVKPSKIVGKIESRSVQKETELSKEEKDSIVKSVINSINSKGIALKFIRFDEFIKETINKKYVVYTIDSLSLYDTARFEEIILTVKTEGVIKVGIFPEVTITLLELEPEFEIDSFVEDNIADLDPNFFYRDGRSKSVKTVDENEVAKVFQAKINAFKVKTKEGGLGTSGDDFLCFGSTNVRADDKLECETSGGTWDRPCFQNEDCPFFDEKKGNGTCNLLSGRCEMPKNTKTVGFRNISLNPLFAPHCNGCRNGDNGKRFTGSCCNEQRDKNIYPELNGKPNYAY